MTTQSKKVTTTTAAKATVKAPSKRMATKPTKKGALKRATKTPIATVKPKTPAKDKTPATTGTKLNLVAPKKNWKIAFRDGSVNGAITSAIGDGAHDLDALVTYFDEHSGMAPNKSLQYKNKPKQYIADYITYLVKHNVVKRA